MSALFRITFFVGDLIFLNLSIVYSYALFDIRLEGDERINSIYLFIFSNLAWLFLVVVSNPYYISRNTGVAKIFKSQISFIFIHLLVVASLIFFFKKFYSPLQIGTMYMLFVPTFFLWKFSMLYAFNVFARKTVQSRNAIIVGQPNLAGEVKKYFSDHPELGYQVLATFNSPPNGLPMPQIEAFCRENVVLEIYCCLSDSGSNDVKKLINFGLDSLIRVKLVADQGFQERSLELEDDDTAPAFNITAHPLDDMRNKALKSAFDVVFSLAVLIIILSWLVPLVGLLIRIDSPGPIFFRQRRNGKDNRPFECLKFRTMIANPDANVRQATRHDERITRVGMLLRKTSLDELPQFFNVLGGTMSIVGPRPHMIKHNEEYGRLIKKFTGRHYIKPGITGLAQSMGYRGETRDVADMRNRVKLDHFYIENWSFLLDVRIIILTVLSLVRGSEKAY